MKLRIQFFPRYYERTCNNCAFKWQLSRNQAKMHSRIVRVRPPTISMPSQDGAREQVRYRETAIETMAEQVAQFRRCPKCGSTHFTQRAIEHLDI